MFVALLSVLSLALIAQPSLALDNGLALTPPMGWLSWERFRCDVDCKNDPDNCISEKLYMDMADRMSADGYSDVGYQYVNIDDCWAEFDRDPNTQRQIANKERFPHGIKALADYVHSKGLKLGIYGDYGTHTCGGYPGSQDYLQIDAQTFADWGVDSLKLDGCYSSIDEYPYGYPNMSLALNATGRPIMYACSWPAYWEDAGKLNETDFARIHQYCNYWRNYADINDDWNSVADIIEWWGTNQAIITPHSGPGGFNDPDMILCGDFALSIYECRAQFALWSIWSAPLLMSVDLRRMDPAAKAVVTNKAVIAIDQDPLGKQGQRVDGTGCNKQGNNCAQSVWAKPLANGDIAVVLYNRESSGMPTKITANWDKIGAPKGSKWVVVDLYEGKTLGGFTDSFTASINTHEAKIYRLRAAQEESPKVNKRRAKLSKIAH